MKINRNGRLIENERSQEIERSNRILVRKMANILKTSSPNENNQRSRG